MARRDVQNDRRIDDLIAEARKISKPTDRIPLPPSQPGTTIGPAFGEDRMFEMGELDRTEPPPWFHPNADEPTIEAPDDETPILADDFDVPPDARPQDRQTPGRFGTEALAYYAPFHFYGPTYWGIYIRDWGLTYLACAYKGVGHLTPSDAWILRGAYRFLLEHERFHFRTELGATRLQFLTGSQGLFNAQFHDRRAAWLEEGMANASAHRQLVDEAKPLGNAILATFVTFLENWMRTQPPGYRDYELWSRSHYYYGKGMRAVTVRMLELTIPQHPNADPYTLDLYKRSGYSKLPVRRVRDSGCSILDYFKPFPKANGMQAFVYTRDHPPPHVHVEWIASGRMVKLRWPDLVQLDKGLQLTSAERQAVSRYLTANQDKIQSKLQSVFPAEHVPKLMETQE